MKKYIILIIMFLSGILQAQNPFNILIGGNQDDVSTGISILNNDSIILTSSIEDFNNINNGFAISFYNSHINDTFSTLYFNSNMRWATKFKKTEGSVLTSTGWYYMTTHSDVALAIYNYDLNQLIVKKYGGNNHDIGYDFVQLADTGYMIVGSTESYGAGGTDIYIIRTDKFGDTIWTKTYGNSEGQEATNIVKENDSTFVIAGSYGNSAIGNSGPFLMKIDLNGDTIQVVYNAFIDYLNSLIKINNNEFIIAGRNWDSQNYPAALMKLDNNFNVIWSKEFKDYAEVLDVKQTSDNGYILVGYCKNNGDDIYVVKTDANGDTLWTKEIGGSLADVAYSVIEAPDSSGYVIAGYTHSYGNGGSDAFLLKLKPNGDLTTSIGLEISPKYLEAKVFPNPISEEFNLKIDNYSGELQMQIIDISGKSIYKENLNIVFNFQKSFKLKNLSSGVYNISLKGDDFEKALKLVVE